MKMYFPQGVVREENRRVCEKEKDANSQVVEASPPILPTSVQVHFSLKCLPERPK